MVLGLMKPWLPKNIVNKYAFNGSDLAPLRRGFVYVEARHAGFLLPRAFLFWLHMRYKS